MLTYDEYIEEIIAKKNGISRKRKLESNDGDVKNDDDHDDDDDDDDDDDGYDEYKNPFNFLDVLDSKRRFDRRCKGIPYDHPCYKYKPTYSKRHMQKVERDLANLATLVFK
jgi:hypothetical protein